MSVSNTTKQVKEIRRKTRRNFSSEEKIHIVLGGLQWVDSSYSRLISSRSACASKAVTRQA